jgi:hypothetical protein
MLVRACLCSINSHGGSQLYNNGRALPAATVAVCLFRKPNSITVTASRSCSLSVVSPAITLLASIRSITRNARYQVTTKRLESIPPARSNNDFKELAVLFLGFRRAASPKWRSRRTICSTITDSVRFAAQTESALNDQKSLSEFTMVHSGYNAPARSPYQG